MNLLRRISALLLCFGLLASTATAQSIDAHKIPDADFVRVEFIKFKPGGEDRAFALEDKYITPAWKASGLTPPLELHLQTGPWDRIYVYDLKCGLSEVEWQVSPDREIPCRAGKDRRKPQGRSGCRCRMGSSGATPRNPDRPQAS